MAAFYNEFDQFAAAWLRELIKAGEIADGEVSEADMWDVIPSELANYGQVHLCAGIGGWSAALRLAGWPDDKPVWTVSLPCQSFSAAGKGNGLADERGKLADAFFWLAGICRPDVIFGEQVEAAIKHDWWDVMASQLESIGYTLGAVSFPASSVGAFHLRQRLYWVAYSGERTSQRDTGSVLAAQAQRCGEGQHYGYLPIGHSDGGPACGVADAEVERIISREWDYSGCNRERFWRSEQFPLQRERGKGLPQTGENIRPYVSNNSSTGIMAYAVQSGSEDRERPGQPVLEQGGSTGILGDSDEQGPQGWSKRRCSTGELFVRTAGISSQIDCGPGESGHIADYKRGEYHRPGPNFWSDAIWIPCRDGKHRPVPRATQSEVERLVDGISGDLGLVRLERRAKGEVESKEVRVFAPLVARGKNRVGRLRGYGNAIVVQAAAEFIRAYLEI